MSETVERVTLPNGNWWDIETNPTGKQMNDMQVLPKKYPDIHNSYVGLAVVTVGWSFEEPVTPETINDRRMTELIPAMALFNEKVLDFLASAGEASNKRLKNYLQPSTNDKSLQSMHLSPSWKQQGGHGPN